MTPKALAVHRGVQWRKGDSNRAEMVVGRNAASASGVALGDEVSSAAGHGAWSGAMDAGGSAADSGSGATRTSSNSRSGAPPGHQSVTLRLAAPDGLSRRARKEIRGSMPGGAGDGVLRQVIEMMTGSSEA